MKPLPALAVAALVFAAVACAGGSGSGETPRPDATRATGAVVTPAATSTEAASGPTPVLKRCQGRDTYLGGTPIPEQGTGGTSVETSAFCGTVTVGKRPAPDGTVVEAAVEGRVCDRTTAEDGQYTLTVALGVCPPEEPGGGFLEGLTVNFRIGGRFAGQSARLSPSVPSQRLDLSTE